MEEKKERSKFRKYMSRTFDAVVGTALAAHLTLFSVPDLTSSELEEYMQDNDIPMELVEGVDISNIRVYDSNNFFAALDNAGREFISPPGGSDGWYNDYANGFNRVWHDKATAIHAEGEGRIIMYPERSLDEFKDFLASHTGIPAEDLEVTDEMNNLAFLYVLRHEVEHIHDANIDDLPSVHTDSTRHGIGRALKSLTMPSENEQTLEGEFDADYGAIKAINNAMDTDVSDYVISWRAAAFLGHKSTHDTEFYLHSKLDDPDAEIDFLGHEVDRGVLVTAVSRKLDDYPDDIFGKYRVYMSVLDVIDDIEAGKHLGSEDDAFDDLRSLMRQIENDLGLTRDSSNTEYRLQTPERVKKMAELYVQGFEFLAPTKARELQELRLSFQQPPNNPTLDNY